MTYAVRCASIILTAVTLSACAAAAQAQSEERRALLDTSLATDVIRLISISDEAIIYEDSLGRRRQATIGGFVALAPALSGELTSASRRTNSVATDGVLELTDGQRFPGRPAETGGEDDALVWSHPTFGLITAPIDSIARVAMRGGGGVLTSDNLLNDQLALVNGDRMVGFVLSLGDPVEFEVGNEIVELPRDVISEATFANPPSPMSGMVVWLDDGSVAVVASLETKLDESVSVQLPGGQTALVPLDEVRAVAFDAGRLRALASLEVLSQRPIGERGVFDPARAIAATGAHGATDLNTPGIELPGPMEVRWALPAGALRFAAVAELPLESLPWGDLELVVSQSGNELLRRRLNQSLPRTEFSLAVEPGELRIAVEPGANGPISDRVLLRRPLLLIE